jgi:carbon monoxide dehydrogenase subunit G
MKVELEKTFPMPATAEVAWVFLQDIQGVAGCMPGAKITERVDDTHYKGTVAVRVGPASMTFKGDIEVRELDASQRLLHLIGKGSDTTGSSGASMDLVARIEPGASQESSNLVGRSQVTMSGKATTFGGRMMGTVADQILKQFAGNFAAQVQARAAVTPATNAGTLASPPSTATAEGAAPVGKANPDPAAIPAGAVGASNESGSQAVSPPPTQTNELNALTLFWAILRDWFRGLFRRKPA